MEQQPPRAADRGHLRRIVIGVTAADDAGRDKTHVALPVACTMMVSQSEHRSLAGLDPIRKVQRRL